MIRFIDIIDQNQYLFSSELELISNDTKSCSFWTFLITISSSSAQNRYWTITEPKKTPHFDKIFSDNWSKLALILISYGSNVAHFVPPPLIIKNHLKFRCVFLTNYHENMNVCIVLLILIARAHFDQIFGGNLSKLVLILISARWSDFCW